MKKVFVGLSGGVDSAVSAALLKERGYDVTGVFIKIWQPEFIECTWREDRLDAMRCAAHLEIPFLEIDLSADYQTAVVQAMIDDYQAGITPNPDVLCNTHIKFGAFFDWAVAHGAEYVATGHYARSREGRLMRGIDSDKDQSYFLHGLGTSQLQRILFPVGEYAKPYVRQLAEKLALPNATRPDSQGLCFIGDVSMKDFLARFIPLQRGDVIGMDGAVVGSHDGAALYTIGQRHGFTISGTRSDGSTHFVTRVDTERNTITVSNKRDDAAVSSATVRDMHWIAGTPTQSSDVSAQVRYRERPSPASLTRLGGDYVVAFGELRVISPGQSLVLYQSDVCLGGGVVAHN